jgi:hypothetical protein
MKIARFVCLVCLVLGVKIAAGQDALEVPADPTYPSVMEIRPEYRQATENPYRTSEEVAQATRPSTTLAPPVVRGAAPAKTPAPAAPRVVANGPSVPPEMWLYSEQVRRHDDPAQAVRRKAELRAEQRMGRIASMKWFGFSNSRPQASPIPMMGAYSPAWIGNGDDRYDWVGASWASSAVVVENYNYDVRR